MGHCRDLAIVSLQDCPCDPYSALGANNTQGYVAAVAGMLAAAYDDDPPALQ